MFRGAYYNIGMSMKYNTMLNNNTVLKKYNVKSHQIALWRWNCTITGKLRFCSIKFVGKSVSKIQT